MLYFRLAWRNIWRNKRRTWITVASVCFSVLLAFGMSSMQLASYDNMINNTVRYYSGYAQIHQKGYWEKKSLNKSFVYKDTLREILQTGAFSDLKGYVPRLESFALASSGELTRGAMIMGIHPEKEQKLMDPRANLVQGDYFESAGERAILLSKGLAEQLNATVNDTLVLLGQGYHGVQAADKYPVGGIVNLPSPKMNDRLIFLPLKTAQEFFSAYNRLTSVALLLPGPEHVAPVLKRLKKKLPEGYDVKGWREMNPELVQAIEADRAGGYIMLIILYIVIGFGIFGTVIMMTLEREKEFGILVSIGLFRKRLFGIVFLEILFIALTGLLSGFALAYPVLYYLKHHPIPLSGNLAKIMENFGMDPVIPFSLEADVFTGQILIVFIISLLTASYPLYKISTLKAVEAIRK